ncbi:MAG: hypothetical protein LC747_01210, partial [Acidobacteria bacterium]|nr:hypothetical protein [Acidobacteriota bacterium]
LRCEPEEHGYGTTRAGVVEALPHGTDKLDRRFLNKEGKRIVMYLAWWLRSGGEGGVELSH